jgi:hypothetical protein
MPARNQDCDNCGGHYTKAGSVRRLDTGGGSGAYLCKGCWKKEMKWRKMRNEKLSGSARFPIKKFPEE